AAKKKRRVRAATGRWLQHSIGPAGLVCLASVMLRTRAEDRYGLFGDGAVCGAGAPCGAGAGAGGAKNDGTVAAGLATGTGALPGFSKRNSCIASPAQKLVRYCVRMVSQMRRASSFLFFPFRMYTCESNASGALKLFG